MRWWQMVIGLNYCLLSATRALIAIVGEDWLDVIIRKLNYVTCMGMGQHLRSCAWWWMKPLVGLFDTEWISAKRHNLSTKVRYDHKKQELRSGQFTGRHPYFIWIGFNSLPQSVLKSINKTCGRGAEIAITCFSAEAVLNLRTAGKIGWAGCRLEKQVSLKGCFSSRNRPFCSGVRLR